MPRGQTGQTAGAAAASRSPAPPPPASLKTVSSRWDNYREIWKDLRFYYATADRRGNAGTYTPTHTQRDMSHSNQSPDSDVTSLFWQSSFFLPFLSATTRTNETGGGRTCSSDSGKRSPSPWTESFCLLRGSQPTSASLHYRSIWIRRMRRDPVDVDEIEQSKAESVDSS